MSQQSERRPPVSRRQWLAAVTAATVIVWIAFYVALRAGSQFFADDFLYLKQGRQHITPTWLAVDSYGHFAPVFRLIYAFVARVGGVSWPLAAGVLATLDALIFLSLAWLATSLLGRRPLALVIALAGATSVPALRTSLWMASGVQVLGGAFCMALCTAAFVAYLMNRRRGLLLASVAALALGLVWYERPVLTIGYLFLIRYLFFPPSNWRPAKALIRREAVLWAPYVAVIAVYLWYRLFVFDSHPEPGNKSTAIRLLVHGVAHSYLPSLVGVRESQTSGWSDAATIAGLVVLAAIFAFLALTRRGLWRCVVFLAATYGANVAVQAAGRLGTGADPVLLSRDLQYFVDPYLATVMTVLLAAVLPRREQPRRRERMLVVTAAVTASVVALTTVRSWHTMVDDNAQTYAHGYLNSALSQLRNSGTVDLVSLRVPIQVAPSFIAPFNDQRRFFDIDGSITRGFDSNSPRKVVITATGNVAPVHPVSVTTADPEAIQAASGQVSITQPAAGATCVSGTAGGAVGVPINARPPAGSVVAVQVAYDSPRATKVMLASRHHGGERYNQWPTTLPSGTGRSVVVRLDSGPGQMLQLVLLSRASQVCIHSVSVVLLAVDTPDGCQTIDQYGQFTGRPADCSQTWPATS